MEVEEHLNEAHRLLDIAEHNRGPDHRDYGHFLLACARTHIDLAGTHRMIEDSDENWLLDNPTGQPLDLHNQ